MTIETTWTIIYTLVGIIASIGLTGAIIFLKHWR